MKILTLSFQLFKFTFLMFFEISEKQKKMHTQNKIQYIPFRTSKLTVLDCNVNN